MHLKKSIPNDPSNAGGEESKEPAHRYALSKFEYDLYLEENDIAFPIVRVKRIALPNNGERWRIFHDTKLVMTLEGAKLTKKERAFLRSVPGVNFLLQQFKKNIPSFSAIKKEIKGNLK
jgi:hypothetical protein